MADGGAALVDAHVHVWDPARLTYPWLEGVLGRAFLPADIDRAAGSVTRHVFVQAGCLPAQALDEVRWVLGMADAWPELAAIVADADLRGGRALESHLDELLTLDTGGITGPRPGAGGSAAGRRIRVAGIRHLLQGEPDDLLADPAARSALLGGLRALAARGLTFDVCVRHRQLNTVIELLEQVPELPTVLDHLGKPPVDEGIESEAGRAWAEAITRLARLPLAHMKLSGLAAESSGTAALDAHAEAILVHALRAFGPDRTMIGSDWPVSALTGAGGTFESWRERVRRAAIAAGVGPGGVASIEHGTAAGFYGLW